MKFIPKLDILASATNLVANGGRIHRRGEGEKGLVGRVRKMDNNAAMGYGEQVGAWAPPAQKDWPGGNGGPMCM